MDTNLPANAGDKASIPGPGRFHIPKSDPWATTMEACAPTARALQQGKPPQ